MDGALSALCGAFDAAVGGLSLASELHDHLTPSQRTPQHKYNWNILRAKLAALESTESKVQAAELTRRVDDALRRDPDSGYGWLTELRDLRNRAVHRDTLARHIFVTVGEPGSDTYDDWRISVGQAARPEHPVAYLRESQHKLTDLLAPMLNLMDTLWPDGGSGPAGQQSVTIQL